MNILIDILNQLHVTNYLFLVFFLFVFFFIFINKIIIQPILELTKERSTVPNSFVVKTQKIDSDTITLEKKYDETLHEEKKKIKTEFEKKLKEHNLKYSEEISNYSKTKKNEFESIKNQIDSEGDQLFGDLEKEAEKMSELLVQKLIVTGKDN